MRFLAEVFGDNITTHAKSDSHDFCLRIPIQDMGYHRVQVFCASVAEYSVRCQLDLFQRSNVVENCAPVSFSLSVVYKCSYVDGFTWVANARTQHQSNIL